MNALEKAWYQRRSWSLLLAPLSWLFTYLAKKRRNYLQRHRKALQTPVIVVGNITVGGTGKTPLIISLVKALQHKGYHPGVVSRGYGGKSPFYPLQVTPESNPFYCGDEPLLIARSCACPVMVDPDRYRAAKLLQDSGTCDLILSDDGLQHYNLPRMLEIVVVDGERMLGNGWCLPAGPLREPVSRLEEVDFVIINGGGDTLNHPHQYRMDLQPLAFRNLNTGEVLEPKNPPGSDSVHAVAGIGNPARFARTLASLGLAVRLHPFPDHHDFCASDLHFDDDRPVIVTAKDAVKCAGFTSGQSSLDNVWVLDVAARLENNGMNTLVQAIEALVTQS
ncbi:MAG: tetraacyldisaccharide 4'-kinase [Porticoccaceae bacterium]|jgi:tetraacyldisaccharide 4'-kinase